MKQLILMLALIGSFSALAKIGPDSSWEEIRNSYDTQVLASQVRFHAADGTHFVSVMDTCYLADSDKMRTAKKVTIYERQDRGEQTIFVPAGFDYLYADRVYETEICGGHGEICDWERETREYNLSPNVDVHSAPAGDRSFGDYLFTKVFNVPAC